MDVKSIQPIQSYHVNTANEARDEEKGQENRRRKPDKKKATAETTAPAVVSTELVAGNETSLRQIVDSEKVLQLLALRPSVKETVKGTFGKLHPFLKTPVESSPNKKVNRSF